MITASPSIPNKAVVIPFTRKRLLSGLRPLWLYGKQLQWATEVKYLGVTLDKELTWRAHADNTIAKALRVLGMCRSAYGKTWGLKPKVMRWLYSMMIRPIITYGSIAWWPRSQLTTYREELSKLQRTACLAITGAFKTTPTAAMEKILDLTPLHIVIETEARLSLHRLAINGLWDSSKPRTRHTKFSP